ncbi:hypothetical protein B484DRAFT_445277 [Ochromonadaceae sp. CCMP2298]|nr:hypothetical protein B484DRAFT_445994 [Ochromonadaceae sp. CCMP2298]KAJ1437231.1 hypothetical protein B484DRAFT_445277 [Ochromonadaceae sp. CCMP2298]
MRLALALLLLGSARQSAADYIVYGLFFDYATPLNTRQEKEIYSKCFSGLSLVTCTPKLPDDDIVLAYDRDYYQDLGAFVGQAYCVECCGTNPDKVDVWDLSCPVTAASAIAANRYGAELHLARNQFVGDTAYVMCPLKRSVCTYDPDTGKTITCDRSLESLFLRGYTVFIKVKMYDDNFEFRRGVSSCEIQAWETDTPLAVGESFSEKIIMQYEAVDSFSIADVGKLVIVCLGCFVFVYAALYFCRRKHCEYCQGKLVFGLRLCYKCIAVGAEVPDQHMLAAIHARNEAMQGKHPDRFPGHTMAKGCARKGASCLFSCLKCLGCSCCHSCCYRCCCYCCKKKDGTVEPDLVEVVELMEASLEEGKEADAITDELDTMPSKKKKKKGKKGEEDSPHSPLPVMSAVLAGGVLAAAAKKKRFVNPNNLAYHKDFIQLAVMSVKQ